MDAPASTRVPRPGHTLLRGPNNLTACTAGGVEYFVDADGILEIPSHDAAELLSAGGIVTWSVLATAAP
jgi:hypothetical protein